MKVLHIAPYYPPHRVGGVGVFVARLHRALSAAGVASQVWTRAPAGAALERGVERIATSPTGWLASLVSRVSAARAFDVVHVHSGEALPFLAALRGVPHRPRIVATWHVSAWDLARTAGSDAERFRAMAHAAGDRLALPLMDAVAWVSRACAVEVLGAARGAAATVIHHGLPAPDRPSEGSRLPRASLLYVGIAGNRKRVGSLPSVLDAVRRVRPDTRLRIAGFSADAAPGLHAAFTDRDLAECVDWDGVLPPDRLAAAYRAADVLVAPAAYEGVPLAVLEAMQHAVPVVATNIAGHSLAIDDGVTGSLVPVDDAAAMAARCIELLDDAPRRRAMGEAAAKAVGERFDLDRHVRAYCSLYGHVRREAA